MNTITPKMTGTQIKSKIAAGNKIEKVPENISFKGAKGGAAAVKSLISTADRGIMDVFSQHYGSIGDKVGERLATLAQSSDIIGKSSRFSLEKGALSIKEKGMGRAVVESAVFPFVTLPLELGNAAIKQAKKVPSLKSGAEKAAKNPLLKLQRHMSEVDTKTDILKGMYEKTKQTVEKFAKEKGVTSEELIARLNDKNAAETPLVQEANEYIKESLYKVSNKFFDKHTGNFNTAHERPLNRIVTGLIPMAFLANDAYNLSVMCGDKKEDSVKEANSRTKQELSRVFTTAYIQLMTFGAFTKQVNTIPWFAPLTSAATVLFSEISSRKRLDKPIFFLSKDKAKDMNRKKDEKNITFNSAEKSGKKEVQNVNAQTSEGVNDKYKVLSDNLVTSNNAPSIFTSFKAAGEADNIASKSAGKEEGKDKTPKKALINFNTFKKGVGILIGAGFALSFLKNSSLTKNSGLMKGMKKIGNFFEDKVYKPLAFKDFEMPVKKFEGVTEALKEAGCEKIAEGHEFIMQKYGKVSDGVIKMYKTSLSSKKVPGIASAAVEAIGKAGSELTASDAEKVTSSITKAIASGSSSVAEKKFSSIATKAQEIIQNKKVNLTEEQIEALKTSLVDSITSSVSESAIQIERKSKPFVDVVTSPFKFILSAVKLPFKMTSTALKLAVAPVEKKAEAAAVGKAELTNLEKGIHKAVTEIFGEKQAKKGTISQTIFANAMERFDKRTMPFMKASQALKEAEASGSEPAIRAAKDALEKAKANLAEYVNNAVEKSFNGVTQSSNKNTDLALMSKLASSTVTSAFLVADNYNMVMLKSDGEDKEGAKEKANERIIQRLSALFYQTMFINWYNSTFRRVYNSSLAGMTAVAIPNTLTTEIVTRKSIGMPVGRKTAEELRAIDEKNENRKGFAGKYFEFMRLLTGKKPLKDRLPKEKQSGSDMRGGIQTSWTSIPAKQEGSIFTQSAGSKNLLDRYINQR